MHDDAVQMIRLKRAADAWVPPSRPQHEMLDDQLAAIREQVGERLFAVLSLDHVFLFDLDPWQGTPLFAEPVACASPFLFLDQKGLARLDPLVARNYPM